MVDKRRVITIGLTLIVAAAAGHFMQNGFAFAARTDVATHAIASGPADKSQIDIASALPTPPMDTISPEKLVTPPPWVEGRIVAAVSFQIEGGSLTDAPTPLFSSSFCEPTLVATAKPGAMMDVALSAPCNPNERIVVGQADLEFSDATGGDGSYFVSIPVMNNFDPISVRFANGSSVEAKPLVQSLELYDRVAITWQGGGIMHIHALENGAEFGSSGHVWSGSPGISNPIGRPTGGFLTSLGNPDVMRPKFAEVYSFPAGHVNQAGAVRLSVEAEVSDITCGKEIVGQTHQISGSGVVNTTQIALTIPACDSVGGFLVLKNLLQDMKIARN
ncbi:MAG: hypothetical protein KUG69_06910 [Marinosulfonomonas sp.]|nr:hypothetical protein [Marinosulfonomonas sp.]